MIFTGSAPALITPFTKDGLDLAAFVKLCKFCIEEGSDALVVCGTTGEPSTMTSAEKEALISAAVEVAAKRLPVIAGTGGNDTQEVIRASQRAEQLGADALLIVTPYYNKCTQSGLIMHYNMVADSVNLPIILYNVPARTGLNMTAATVKELAAHKNIVALKEASGDLNQIAEIIRTTDLDVYSGDDGLTLPIMSLGGKGVISVAANVIPNLMHLLVASYQNGDIETSRKLTLKLYPFFRATVIEVNPIPIKTAASLMGMCHPIFRMPLTNMEEKTFERLKDEMSSLGLI